MNEPSSLELVQACIRSCNQAVDWIEERETDDAIETLQLVLDDLETLEHRLERTAVNTQEKEVRE